MFTTFKSYYKKISFANALLAILAVQVINLLYYLLYLNKYNYLPAPFVSDKYDTLMDFYNPLFWVLREEFYSTYKSVYPALNYYFLKIFTFGIDLNYILSPFQLREDYLILGFAVSIFYILIIWLVINLGEWKKNHTISKLFVFFVCVLSIPVLFGIERGNLIFLALLFLALHLNAKGLWAKAIFLGLLINVKPYFVIFLLQYLNIYQFNIKELLRAVFISILIFFSLGETLNIDYLMFFSSYLEFAKNTTISVEGIVALPHSIAAFSSIKKLIIFGEGSRFTAWFSFLKVINYLVILMMIFFSLRKRLTNLELLIFSFFIMTNFSISTGGYILILYIILIPYLLSSEEYRKLIVYILLICVVPWDWVDLININYTHTKIFFGGGGVIENPDIHIGMGSLARPFANFFMAICYLNHIYRKYHRPNFSQIH